MDFEETAEVMTLKVEKTRIVATVMTESEYRDCYDQSLPIFDNIGYQLQLERYLLRQEPDFDYPQLYAALRTRFGESSAMYDHYKCSFAYHFLLKITKNRKKREYMAKLCDVRGGLDFSFRKILTTSTERKKYTEQKRLVTQMSSRLASLLQGWLFQ